MATRWSPEEMARIRSAALALLEELPRPVPVEPPPRCYSVQYEAAAVVTTFRIDREPSRNEDAMAELRRDATELPAKSGVTEWALLPDVRIEVLRQLIGEGRLGAVLREHRREDDALQRALSSVVGGTPPFHDLDAASLAALVPLLPLFPALDARDVTRRLELMRILEPFRHLVQTFRGRETELRQLRNYVGVAAPESALEALTRGVRSALNLEQRQPCLVVGPGGIGKSTLVAKFILDHALLAEREKFPFAYVDFDRPVFDLAEPATILPEIVRQIGYQYADAEAPADGLRKEWARLFESSVRDAESRTARIVRDFQSFLDTHALRDKPFLLVLDTFEEIQYQSRTFVRRLGELLAQLSRSIPRLRTVIAGRAEPNDIAASMLIRLTELDAKAALGFLTAKGIEEKAAQNIVSRVGGHPLTLHLAAALYAQEGAFELDVRPNQLWSLPASEQLVRGLLYRRILAHVHNEDVRRLAHPGLLLRRITPEIIREVLAEPAGLSIPADGDARRLFEELRCEVAIVTRSGEDELITRPDVRRIVLGFAAAEPERALLVHSLAVAYYVKRLDTVSRTEEVYHRLMRDEPAEVLDERFTEDLIPDLATAMDELPPRAKTYLADRLEHDLPAAAWLAAEDKVWERAAVRRVGQRLRSGEFQEALKVIRERSERSEKTPLLILEAETLTALDRLDEAQSAIDRGLHRYPPGSIELAILLNYNGMLRARRGDPDEANASLRAAAKIAKSRGDDLMLLNTLLNLASISREGPGAAVQHELREVAFRVPPEILKRDPRFFRRLLSQLPEEDAQQLDHEGADELAAEHRRRSAGPSAHLRLNPRQRKAAVEFFLYAFPSLEGLREFLALELDRSLESLTMVSGNLRQIMVEITSAAERQGWLGDLLSAARDVAVDDISLGLFDALGERITIDESNSREAISIKAIRSQVQETRRSFDLLERWLCRLEIRGKIVGTGWRALPGVVITASSSIRTPWKELIVRFESFRIGNWMSSGVTSEVNRANELRDPLAGVAILSTVRADRTARWKTLTDLWETLSPDSAPPTGDCLWLWHDTNGLHVSGVRNVENVTETHFTIPAATPHIAAGALCVDSLMRPIGLLVEPGSGPSSLAVRLSALAPLLADADPA